MKLKEQARNAGNFIWEHKFEISTVVLGATLGILLKNILEPYDIDGCAYFDDGESKVTDEEVYQFVKDHSTFLQRINPRKTAEMALFGFAMISPDKDGTVSDNSEIGNLIEYLDYKGDK